MSTRDRVRQGGARAPQSDREPSDLNRAPLDLSRATYLSVRQAADYLQLASEWAVYRFVRAHAIPKCYLSPNGRGPFRLLRRDIDEAVQKTRNAGDDRRGLRVVRG